MELTFTCIVAAIIGTLIIYGLLRAFEFVVNFLLDTFGYDSPWPSIILIFGALFILFLVVGLTPPN